MNEQDQHPTWKQNLKPGDHVIVLEENPEAPAFSGETWLTYVDLVEPTPEGAQEVYDLVYPDVDDLPNWRYGVDVHVGGPGIIGVELADVVAKITDAQYEALKAAGLPRDLFGILAALGTCDRHYEPVDAA